MNYLNNNDGLIYNTKPFNPKWVIIIAVGYFILTLFINIVNGFNWLAFLVSFTAGLFLYLFLVLFQAKQFFVYENSFIIKYLVSPFHSDKIFALNDIEFIDFKKGGSRDPDWIVIKFKNKKSKTRFYFNNVVHSDTKELIKILISKGVVVKTKAHVWLSALR